MFSVCVCVCVCVCVFCMFICFFSRKHIHLPVSDYPAYNHFILLTFGTEGQYLALLVDAIEIYII